MGLKSFTIAFVVASVSFFAGAFVSTLVHDSTFYALPKDKFDCYTIYLPTNECVIYGINRATYEKLSGAGHRDNNKEQGKPVRPIQPPMRSIVEE